MNRLLFLAASCSMLPAATAAWAFVEAVTPLSKIVQDSQVVIVAKVEKINTDNNRAVLVVEEMLLGEPEIVRGVVELEGRPTTEHGVHPSDLINRLAPEQRVVLFVTHLPGAELVFAYTRGTWFQITGQLDGGVLRAKFQNSEPFLRRTYRGDVEQLVALLKDHAQGRGSLPDIDPAVKPGVGPAIGEPVGVPPLGGQEEDRLKPGLQPSGQSQVHIYDDEAPSGAGKLSSSLPLTVWTILGIAAAGLVVMLTRSTPMEAADA